MGQEKPVAVNPKLECRWNLELYLLLQFLPPRLYPLLCAKDVIFHGLCQQDLITLQRGKSEASSSESLPKVLPWASRHQAHIPILKGLSYDLITAGVET